MRVFLETYGTDFNVATSEIMASILKNKGHQFVAEDNAELIIINSCALKGETERKVFKRLAQLKDSKKHVLVTGTLPEIAKEKIQEMHPDASIVGLSSITHIADAIEKMQDGNQVIRFNDTPRSLVNLARVRINPAIGNIIIAEGSSDNSKFSNQRLLHGSMICYTPDAIIKDVIHALDEGAKEINLTSLDVASYGKDLGIGLPALLRRLTSISGNFKIKLGQMSPKNVLPMLEDLILAFSSPKMYQYVDIALHSGSNNVLKSMNLGYTSEEYKLLVASFRKKLPNITISTDITVGFPGETDEDFQKTLDLLNEVKPDMIHVNSFDSRQGTDAAKMQQIPSWKIKNRVIEGEHLAEKIMSEKNMAWQNWHGEAVILEKNPLGCIARNFAYKPIYMQSGILGNSIKVKIVESKEDHLVGQMVG